MMLKILCFLFWIGAGFLENVYLQQPHIPLFLFLSGPLLTTCLLLWFSSSKLDLLIHFTLFLAGSMLCFMIDAQSFKSLPVRLAVITSLFLMICALPLFSFLHHKDLGHTITRICGWLAWILAAFLQPDELVPLCLSLAFLGGAALSLKAAGFNIFSNAYWKAKAQEKLEAKRLEAKHLFLESLMRSHSSFDSTN